ncbi:hypothetical protein HY641_00900 [Candidatus Woesearchaeota archaeon]|nr:hypothetical protein [Candidatus Woesearchaeota archaeon]
MHESFVDDYEYEDGIELPHSLCYICPICKNVFFIEEQAKDAKRRTQDIKKKDSKARIVPMQDKGFLVQVLRMMPISELCRAAFFNPAGLALIDELVLLTKTRIIHKLIQFQQGHRTWSNASICI